MKELIEKRKTILAEAEAITALAKTEDRDLTLDEGQKILELSSEAQALSESIETAQAVQKAQDNIRHLSVEANKPLPTRSVSVDSVIEVGDDNRLKDPKRGFSNMGGFATAVMAACNPGATMVDERLKIMAAASGMNQNVGSEGGFLVPPEFSSTIWDGLNKTPDNLLAQTDQFTIEGESISFPANAETSRANGSRYGGVQGFWLAEAAQITSSNPTVRQTRLEPQQLAVLVFVTDKLLKNSPTALDQYVTRAATDEINFKTSDAIIEGTGSGQPLGILNSGALVTVAKEGAQAADTIVSENIDKMWSRLHPRARAGAVWYINVDTEPQLQQLKRDVGTGGDIVYSPPGGLSAAPFATLKGRPVMPIEYCSTLGDVGDIILADLGFYASGVRGGIDEAMSIHLRFDFAETAFRFMFEVDGRPFQESPITPFKGTATLSPFVTLAARA